MFAETPVSEQQIDAAKKSAAKMSLTTPEEIRVERGDDPSVVFLYDKYGSEYELIGGEPLGQHGCSAPDLDDMMNIFPWLGQLLALEFEGGDDATVVAAHGSDEQVAKLLSWIRETKGDLILPELVARELESSNNHSFNQLLSDEGLFGPEGYQDGELTIIRAIMGYGPHTKGVYGQAAEK